MKSAFRTTILMILIALTATVAAAYYYPWPESDLVSDQIDKPLFEELDMEQVRSIQILKFNDDRNELEDIRLVLKADKWVLPQKSNFVATATPLVALVRSSLNECKVRELMSDTEEDHIKFGVVDPINYSSSVPRSSLGTKLILEDRQGDVIASLIVGKPVKSESDVPQRFARIPEQPYVYVIDYDARILTTDFFQWVDSNLLQLATAANPNGQKTAEININKYRIDLAKIGVPNSRENEYRAKFGTKDNQLAFASLEIPEPGSDEWKAITPNQTQMPELASWMKVIARIPIADVQRKSKTLASVLRNPKEDASDEALKELNGFGIRKSGFENGAFQFEAMGGHFSFITPEGVRFNLLVGDFTSGETKTVSGNLARILMVSVDVDYSKFPEPVNPDDPENKAYLRAVQDRNTKLTQARQTAADLNRIHSDWFYIVDDGVLEMLIPSVTFEQAKTPSQPGEAAAENKEADATNENSVKSEKE